LPGPSFFSCARLSAARTGAPNQSAIFEEFSRKVAQAAAALHAMVKRAANLTTRDNQDCAVRWPRRPVAPGQRRHLQLNHYQGKDLERAFNLNDYLVRAAAWLIRGKNNQVNPAHNS
jgi:hypothetical protein